MANALLTSLIQQVVASSKDVDRHLNLQNLRQNSVHELNLDRFLTAQRDVYDTALKEIRAGKKRTHWIWFVFPQIAGLGLSAMSKTYAIGSFAEAKAYLAHPVLGERLREITEAMNSSDNTDPAAILGTVDAKKFQSSMTLFDLVSAEQQCYRRALDKFFGGRADEATIRQVAIWQKDVVTRGTANWSGRCATHSN